jgi:hypothetical protein
MGKRDRDEISTAATAAADKTLEHTKPDVEPTSFPLRMILQIKCPS